MRRLHIFLLSVSSSFPVLKTTLKPPQGNSDVAEEIIKGTSPRTCRTRAHEKKLLRHFVQLLENSSLRKNHSEPVQQSAEFSGTVIARRKEAK